MNILLVGSCTKKQATPSRGETERQKKNQREREWRSKKNDRARYEEIPRQEEKETIALGQLTVGETKNIQESTPGEKSYRSGHTVPRIRVFTRIEKFPTYRGAGV